jgi:hypothetical protein
MKFTMFEPSTNQFGCVGRGYPKPHPTGRSSWNGVQWACLFARDALKSIEWDTLAIVNFN